MSAALWIFAGFIVVGCTYLALLLNRLYTVSKGSRIPQYEHPKRALLVIDLQKDLTTAEGNLVVNLRQTDKVIAKVNRLIDNAGPIDLEVIYIRHELELDLLLRFLPKLACVKGSVGAELDERLKVINANIFSKQVLDAFSNRQLDDFLRGNRVDHLFFTGVDARFCVDKTLKAALNRGYKSTVVIDAVATKNENYLLKKIRDFKNINAKMITTEELLNMGSAIVSAAKP